MRIVPSIASVDLSRTVRMGSMMNDDTRKRTSKDKSSLLVCHVRDGIEGVCMLPSLERVTPAVPVELAKPCASSAIEIEVV